MALPRNLPAGTVTFLFTDIEGSTRLLRELGDRYAALLADHQRILRTSIREGGGEEVDSQGEATFFAFARAKDAVRAAVAVQRAMATHTWPDAKSVRVRMGLHTGEPERTPSGYVGIDVHRAARICASGHGGQILVSQATRELLLQDLPQGVTLRDLGVHGLKDLARPEHLFQVIVAELPADFPALRSLDAQPNNLPRQLTSFIGRARELAEAEKLLGETSLLTLTGVGGCGKTRLGLQLAGAMLEQFRDGVWVVELAALADPSLVTQAVASALGLREVAGRPLAATLRDYLATKELQLCIDNCEHVLDACASLVDSLLRACPGLRVLATSREALGIGGEVIFPVPSLVASEAVRMFVERARRHRPEFELTPDNVEAVTQVCERLDGIPLALELAAARVRALSVAELAARLGDRFRLLTSGSRTALPRHQTLRAAIDWSYGLLSEPERAVLRRSSVFAGGFGLEAAEEICSSANTARDDVLALLTRLVEKSLLNPSESNVEIRYSMLETVRQFAREKLVDSGEDEAVRSSHLAWYLRLAEAAEPKLESKDQLVWLARLTREHDNFRAALDWALGLENPEPALRLAFALHNFWYFRGYWSEGAERLENALARGAEASAGARANASRAAVLLGSNIGRGPEWFGPLLRQALDLYETLDDKVGLSVSLLYLSMVEYEPLDRAQAYIERSLALARAAGSEAHAARSLVNLCRVALSQGEPERAARLLQEALVAARASGDRWALTLVLDSLSAGALIAADYDGAAAFCREGLSLALELGHKRFIGSHLTSFVEIAGARRQSERVARLLGAISRLADVRGYRVPGVREAQTTPALDAARQALGESAFEAAFAVGRALTHEQAVAYALEHER
jgi:predicted ATPase/class 3 adenylate cyclase